MMDSDAGRNFRARQLRKTLMMGHRLQSPPIGAFAFKGDTPRAESRLTNRRPVSAPAIGLLVTREWGVKFASAVIGKISGPLRR